MLNLKTKTSKSQKSLVKTGLSLGLILVFGLGGTGCWSQNPIPTVDTLTRNLNANVSFAPKKKGLQKAIATDVVPQALSENVELPQATVEPSASASPVVEVSALPADEASGSSSSSSGSSGTGTSVVAVIPKPTATPKNPCPYKKGELEYLPCIPEGEIFSKNTSYNNSVEETETDNNGNSVSYHRNSYYSGSNEITIKKKEEKK